MVQGLGTGGRCAGQRVLQGKSGGVRIDNGRRAFSELLVVLAAELNRLRNETMPVALSQVARYAAPENSAAPVMLGLMLERPRPGRRGDRGASHRAGVAIRSHAGSRCRSPGADGTPTGRPKRFRSRSALVVGNRRGVSDFARLGDVLANMKRHDEAAAAYGRALQLVGPKLAEDRWPLAPPPGSALEEANRWPETRQLLTQALALAPNEPLILNFLGYAKLERGEDLDAAEAMIRKASALAPDDASITDSLGWAVYKRGRTKEAIEILTRAAKGDPTQAEIHEHLGDALYKAGNKFEARYAWSAALVTAEDEVATRFKAKIETGLTPATAAP